MRHESRRNECRSHHTHPAYPTELKKGFVERVSPELVQIVSDEDSDYSDDSEDLLAPHRDSDSESQQDEVVHPEPITTEAYNVAGVITVRD